MASWSIFGLLVGIVVIAAGLLIIGLSVAGGKEVFNRAILVSTIMIVGGLIILLFGSRGCYSFSCNLNA